MLKKVLILTFAIPLTSFSQESLYDLRDRVNAEQLNPPPADYGVRTPTKKEESLAERSKRIGDAFGQGATAVTTIEDAELRRQDLSPFEIRESLDQAEESLVNVRSDNLSQRKKKQLALAWNRLAMAEKKLFGESPKHLEALRAAYDLDPENADIVRALERAERKAEIVQQRLEDAAKMRAALAKN